VVVSDKNGASGLDARTDSRLDNHLTRRGMDDGGEVFSGRLASRALRSVGARAMTVSRSIIVDTTFDTSKVEDRALYAHEKVHLEHSGGEAGHQVRDAEEIAARAAEAMVFHRSAQSEGGAEIGSSQGSASASSAATVGAQANDDGNAKGKRDPSPEDGYRALIALGNSHQDVVEILARKVAAAMQESGQAGRDRHANTKG
jgi:hypothetical protein